MQYVDPSILPLIVLYYVHVHGFLAPVYAVWDAICVKSRLYTYDITAGMYINATCMYSK